MAAVHSRHRFHWGLHPIFTYQKQINWSIEPFPQTRFRLLKKSNHQSVRPTTTTTTEKKVFLFTLLQQLFELIQFGPVMFALLRCDLPEWRTNPWILEATLIALSLSLSPSLCRMFQFHS